MTGYENIQQYRPHNEREAMDQRVMLGWMEQYGENALSRENKVAHFTVSGLIFNKTRDKVLFVHHHIYHTWAWTGGHADGEGDFLGVAIKECMEETGLSMVKPISKEIVSLDILTVQAHEKRGTYVNPHLHLNVSYAMEADETMALHCKEDENSGVKWIPISQVAQESKEPHIIPIYQTIIKRVE